MTTFELYRKHKNGDISREKFLYEVRRDNNLPWITNLTSYDDAISILKYKGIVTDENPVIVGIPAVGLVTEAKKEKKKEVKEASIDVVNPYQYSMGIQYELEKMDDYSDEALEKAKSIVLKNLAKDQTYYTTLLYQDESPYKFKSSETDAKGMQAKADGYLKKEAKKDEKSNVKDNLGKKEAGKKKPKGVKVMPDKGVTGSEKTIKEGIEDKVEDAIKSGKLKPEEVKAAAEKAMKGDSTSLIALMTGIKLSEDNVNEVKGNKYIDVDDEGEYQLNDKAIAAYLKSVISPEEIESVDYFMSDNEGYSESSMYFFDVDDDVNKMPTEKEVEDWAKQEMSYYLFSDPNEFPSKEDIEEDIQTSTPEDQFKQLMSKYDWYYEMSDDPRTYDRGTTLDRQIISLGKQIGVDKAVALFNAEAPSDRKITSTFFMEGKDKLSKIKEALKKALKKEAGEKTAFVTTQGGDTTAVDYKTPEELRKIGDNTDVKRLKTGDGKTIKGS